jgi:hypothetical protein
MKEYIKIGNWNCELKTFEDKMPKGIVVIDHIESSWGDEVTNYLIKSEYDYIISRSKAFIVKRWTIPQKVKMFNRQLKLNELLS